MNEHEQPPHEDGRPSEPDGEHREAAEREPQLHPRIWAGSLSDYNAGMLHGEWLDATQDAEELGEAIAGMLERSPTPGAEEWAIFDYEDFSGVPLSEYENLATVSRIAKGLAEHGLPFAAWANLCELDPEQLSRLEEVYRGNWDSLEAYAEDLLDALGIRDDLEEAIPDVVRPYVRLDIEAFANDLTDSLGIHVVRASRGGVWIFEGQ